MLFEDDEIIEITEMTDEIALMDITVDGNHLFIANGLLTHNSSIEAMGEFDQSHTAGGISKINTCDVAIAIYAPASHKERGEFEFIFLKTRESTGVGHRIKLAYDPTCMRISDPTLTARDVDRSASYADLRKELNAKSEIKPPNAPPADAIAARLGNLMAQRRAG